MSQVLLFQAAHVLWPAYGSTSLQVELYVREEVRVAKVSDTLSCRFHWSGNQKVHAGLYE